MSVTSSITNDIRNYTDTAIEQGKQALEQGKQARKQAVEQAQARLNGVTEHANQFVAGINNTVSKQATDTVNGVRAQAEKSLNVDAIKAAVELYLAPARQYRNNLRELAQLSANLLEALKNDALVKKVVASAGTVKGAVVETVQERVVKPVTTLTGRRRKSAKKTAVTKQATAKAAATRPAKKAPATKAPAKKAPAKKATGSARRAPAKKAQS
jgi:hypothetical protein